MKVLCKRSDSAAGGKGKNKGQLLKQGRPWPDSGVGLDQ